MIRVLFIVFLGLILTAWANPPKVSVPIVPQQLQSIQEVVQRRTVGDSSKPQEAPVVLSDEDSLELQKMSIDFVDADIAEVLRTISAAYGISIIADKDVQGKVTLHLKDVPVMDGLEALCNANGLEVIREGKIRRIRKASEKTINILRMNLQRIDLDVQNRDVKEFIKEFADKTGLKILAGNDLNGTVTGSWKNVVPLEGFKALMAAHGFTMKLKNGFWIVQGGGEAKRQSPMGGRQAGGTSTMDIEVKEGRVSINLEGADLQEVLRAIAEQAKLNIVFYGDAKEVVNATIANATFDEVFSTILKGSRFTYVLTPEGTLLVGEKGARSALSSSVILPLRYLKSENALKLFPKSLLEGGLQISDVKEQNALLVTGAMSEIGNARQFLSLIDVPTLQVALECVIVEFNRGNDFALGLRSRAGETKVDTGSTVFKGIGLTGSLSYTGTKVLTRDLGSMEDVLSIGILPNDFAYELTSNEGNSGAQVLARPSISTLNGNKATINVTNTSYTKVEQISKDGLVASSYQPFNDGISLEITPSVTQAGEISIEIAPEIKTSANRVNADAPRDVSTRTLRTTVNLRDGQTVRLGGLIRSTKNQTRQAVPFFGSLPLVGWLFSYNSEEESVTELVIYITPRVIPVNGLSSDLRTDIETMRKREGMDEVLEEVAPLKEAPKK